MTLTTTIVDDMDLGVAPTNFRADPVKRTAIGRGILGHVHFMWPIGERLRNLTVYYDKLPREHARRLITALGPSSPYNRTLQLHPDGPTWFIPGKVTINASFQGGYVTLQVQTIGRRFGGVA